MVLVINLVDTAPILDRSAFAAFSIFHQTKSIRCSFRTQNAEVCNVFFMSPAEVTSGYEYLWRANETNRAHPLVCFHQIWIMRHRYKGRKMNAGIWQISFSRGEILPTSLALRITMRVIFGDALDVNSLNNYNTPQRGAEHLYTEWLSQRRD